MIEPAVFPADFSFHHIGCAVQSLDREARFYAALGYREESAVFEDSAQGIRGLFMVGQGPRLELLENLPNSNTLDPWIKAGVSLYHFAYVVPDIAAGLSWAQDQKAKVIRPPVPSVAFERRLISFVMFRNRFVVELIEA